MCNVRSCPFVTGIPLPFVSQGGSSLITPLLGLGIQLRHRHL
ncbi:MAG: FtsW/RodA/SpoVE family cell cycle protein, partial [Chloroflexi bacterium]|nr:FtsW/RodA/SpoVE family cell cycle protein [Chloroflexota bacterium]